MTDEEFEEMIDSVRNMVNDDLQAGTYDNRGAIEEVEACCSNNSGAIGFLYGILIAKGVLTKDDVEQNGGPTVS